MLVTSKPKADPVRIPVRGSKKKTAAAKQQRIERTIKPIKVRLKANHR